MREKSKKIKSERYLQSTIKVLVSIFFILFLVGFVNAEWFSFDNVKRYNATTQTIKIVNTFGLGADIAEIKLNTPLQVIVPVGYQKVAEFKLTNYEDYLNAFEKMEFYNIKDNMKSVERQFDYKVLTNVSYEEDKYDLVCKEDLKNESGKTCKYEIIGKQAKYKMEWLPLGKVDFVKGEILTIGIFTQVNLYDNVEWILTAYGKELTEWATYIQSSGTKTYIDIGGLNYTVMTFTSNGTFNSTRDTLNVSILVIAGGAGGGKDQGGGGGAGGVLWDNDYDVAAGNYNVVVGGGGAGGAGSNPGNGSNSSFNNLIAIGGGGSINVEGNGLSGGSGGGGSGGGSVNWQGGLALQGNIGGATGYGYAGGQIPLGDTAGSGGGGAGSVGANGGAGGGGNGGAGYTSSINGTSICYAGGGGGGSANKGDSTATCGGGAGKTGSGSGIAGDNGVNGLGGGGGGGSGWSGTGGIGGSGIVIIRYLTSDGAENFTSSVILNSPTAYQNFTTSSAITFNITATDKQKIENVTLYIDGVLNETNTSNVNGTYLFNKTLSQGKHNWSILVYNNQTPSDINQSATRELWIDTITPALEVFYPTNTTYYLPMFETINNYTIYLNWSVNDTNKDKCWYSNDSGATNRTVTCSNNQTKEFKTKGNYTFDFWANDTFGNLNYSKVYFEIDSKIFQNNRTLNNTESYETTTESYLIFLTANSSLTNVWLSYNGTVLPTVQTGSVWSVSKLLSSSDIGNNSLNWTAQYAGTNYTSNLSYQQVSQINFTLCDGTYTTPYHNITFKDESNLSLIKADVPASTWVYYLGNGTINKTYTYSTAGFNDNYTFCFSPPNRTVYVDYVFQYSGITYPQRTYNPSVLSFNNSIINKTLYLLSNADGIYVTFQVINTAEQPISGVYVNASREISGTMTMVGEGTTGSDGGVTFWLNPDFSHTFYFVKTGYTTYVSTFQPTQSLYTISLGTSTTTTNYDYTQGVYILVTPTNTSLYNNTIYNFSLNLNSTYWDVTKFGFSILNGTGTILYTTSATTNGGYLSTLLDTSGNNSIVMNYYYFVNGTSLNYTRSWMVLNTEGTDWSIKNFASDLKSYATSGMFGLSLGSFAFGILIFLIIIVSVGIMSYKFGLTSPATITGAIFAIVFLLDVGLGLMDTLNPIGAISHFPTIFIAIVAIGLIIRESVK